MRIILGNILIILSVIFICFGVFGIFRFKDFYPRILISSKVDTVGLLTMMLGIIIRSGFTFFSAKVVLIVLLFVITNPLSTHSIARSAYNGGHKSKEERVKL